jgi:hypothetical protein
LQVFARGYSVIKEAFLFPLSYHKGSSFGSLLQGHYIIYEDKPGVSKNGLRRRVLAPGIWTSLPSSLCPATFLKCITPMTALSYKVALL